MNESKFWKQIKDKMTPVLRFMKRIDAANGLPDVYLLTENNQSIWMELKSKPEWPARATTKTDFGLEADQSVWLYSYDKKGGRSYIYVWIDNEYLLFKGSDALKIAAKVTRPEAMKLAIFCHKTRMDWKTLQKEFESNANKEIQNN